MRTSHGRFLVARASRPAASTSRSTSWLLALALSSCAFGQGVQITNLPDYQGQPSYKIQTPSATWIYHKQGAGFASLLDPDGNDWIGYRPGGRAAGEFRGIPNLIHPGAGMHPGGELCSSEVGGQPHRIHVRRRRLGGPLGLLP